MPRHCSCHASRHALALKVPPRFALLSGRGAPPEGDPCIYPLPGCMSAAASNFDPNATVPNGKCEFLIRGCDDSTADNYRAIFGGNGFPDCRPGPALGGLGTYRFCATRVSGPCMRPYNVPNDRVLTPSAGGVGNQQ